jgi:hypothetical protein
VLYEPLLAAFDILQDVYVPRVPSFDAKIVERGCAWFQNTDLLLKQRKFEIQLNGETIPYSYHQNMSMIMFPTKQLCLQHARNRSCENRCSSLNESASKIVVDGHLCRTDNFHGSWKLRERNSRQEQNTKEQKFDQWITLLVFILGVNFELLWMKNFNE